MRVTAGGAIITFGKQARRSTGLAEAANLRRELSARNQAYASENVLPHALSRGDVPSVCYEPLTDLVGHGNFLPETYKAIVRNPNWRRRLDKHHAQRQRFSPNSSEGRSWRELDSSASSDALLMNCFCFPAVFRDGRVYSLLNVEAGSVPEFGFRPGVPLGNGYLDRTEVDMRLGDLLVESKLTEGDFQTESGRLVKSYRDLTEVFDARRLPRSRGRYVSYQLIRNVLAAYRHNASICVFADARRPDLLAAWYEIILCVKLSTLRWRCKMLTWQELAGVLPKKLQRFLAEKYGIESGS